MIIHDMTRTEVEEMLSKVRIGHLACSVDDKPYVVPLRFVYSGGYLYSLSSEGKKIDMMRTNKNVSVSFSDVRVTNDWKSLVVSGLYHDIQKSIDQDSDYYRAHGLLATSPDWWEPAYVKTILRGEERELKPMYFKISVMESTGHKALPKA